MIRLDRAKLARLAPPLAAWGVLAAFYLFAGLRDPITLYFAHSRRYFFEDGNDDAYPYAELVDLVERCRDVERGLG